LPKLLQILDERNTLAKFEQILKIEVHQHQNRMWNELFVKWKRYPIDEATRENEAKLRLTSLIFVMKTMTFF
jgi:hypothetical protein